MSDKATLHTVNGQPTLRFERRLAHSPEKVWRAVSDPAEMAGWFPAAVRAELRAGAPMRFVFEGEDDEWEGEVLEVDPPKVYMFRWAQDVLRFELLPDGDGCLLVFTQTLGGGRLGLLSAPHTATGWVDCLDHLAAGLDGTTVPENANWVASTLHYLRKFHLDHGEVRAVEGGFELYFARSLVWKPLDQVWQILTEDALGDLLPPGATNPHVPAGPIVAAEAPALLEYQWLHDGSPAGTVRWEFTSDPKLGTRVELTQTVPTELAALRAEALAAWQVHLDQFFAAVQGSARGAWPADRVTELTRSYEASLA